MDEGGTGLGLAIAKWAVEVNGGRITVDAADHGGSIFRIVLPTAAPLGDLGETLKAIAAKAS